jgi:hypothetical protein
MNMKVILALVVLVSTIYLSQSEAATAVTGTGVWGPTALLGFDDIEVSGTRYDVRFVDGTFDEIYNSGADLIFITAESAKEESFALMAAFDQDPLWDERSEWNHYVSGTQPGTAEILMPYMVDFGDVHSYLLEEVDILDNATNYECTIPRFGDCILSATTSSDLDFATAPTATIAYWQLATVPISSAVWLFGSGLIGLIGVARRKKT